MNEKRRFMRFPVSWQIEPDSSSRGRSENPCVITDISRDGCRIENVPLSLLKKPRFNLKTYVPEEDRTVNLQAIVRWSAQADGCASAGCIIQETSPGDKFDLMDLAYKKWRAQIPRHANPDGR